MKKYVNGSLMEMTAQDLSFETVTLTDRKIAAMALIEQTATSVRHSHITPDKDSTYINKSAQVDAYIAAGYPADLTGWGYIDAELVRLGLNPVIETDRITAANTIVGLRDQWGALDGMIERATFAGKVSIEAATDEAGVRAALDAAILSLEVYRA